MRCSANIILQFLGLSSLGYRRRVGSRAGSGAERGAGASDVGTYPLVGSTLPVFSDSERA
jgi:hypothetical protein